MDYAVREDDILDEIFEDTVRCENGKLKCCYKTSYESLPQSTKSVCPLDTNGGPFCCHLKSGQECPVVDYDVRGAHPPGQCCYASRSIYDAIPDIKRVCPAEPRFCCRLKAGQECPVPDYDIDPRGNDPTIDDEECCFESRADYDAIPDVQSVCPSDSLPPQSSPTTPSPTGPKVTEKKRP